MKHNKILSRLRTAKNTLMRKPWVSAVYLLLRIAVVVVLVAQFFNGNYENVFLCVLTLLLFLIPTILEKELKIDFPDALEIIILLFIFAAEILGEIRAFYITYPGWDTLLHTLNGFLCAAIGFALVDMLNRDERFSLSLSPVYMAVVAFCFSMTIGVMWEFFECGMDHFLLKDMQKDTVVNQISTVMLDPDMANHTVVIKGITDVILVTDQGQIPLGLGGYLDIGLMDTMKDLAVNFVGAVVFSVIGFFYVKNRGRGKFASSFIPKVVKEAAPVEKPVETVDKPQYVDKNSKDETQDIGN